MNPTNVPIHIILYDLERSPISLISLAEMYSHVHLHVLKRLKRLFLKTSTVDCGLPLTGDLRVLVVGKLPAEVLSGLERPGLQVVQCASEKECVSLIW